MTIFMITHDLKESFQLGTRLLVFDKLRHDPQAPEAYGATVTYDIPLNGGRKTGDCRRAGRTVRPKSPPVKRWRYLILRISAARIPSDERRAPRPPPHSQRKLGPHFSLMALAQSAPAAPIKFEPARASV